MNRDKRTGAGATNDSSQGALFKTFSTFHLLLAFSLQRRTEQSAFNLHCNACESTNTIRVSVYDSTSRLISPLLARVLHYYGYFAPNMQVQIYRRLPSLNSQNFLRTHRPSSPQFPSLGLPRPTTSGMLSIEWGRNESLQGDGNCVPEQQS